VKRVDRVAVVVVASFVAFGLVRAVLPALIEGERIGKALLTLSLLLLTLAISLVPTWGTGRGDSSRRID
jgi:hypothetical protein